MRQSHAISEPSKKLLASYNQLRSDTPKLDVFNRGGNHLIVVQCMSGYYRTHLWVESDYTKEKEKYHFKVQHIPECRFEKSFVAFQIKFLLCRD